MSHFKNSSRSRSRSRERNTNNNDKNKNLSRTAERESLKDQDFSNIHNDTKVTTSRKIEPIINEPNIEVIDDLSKSWIKSLEPLPRLHPAKPYSMKTLSSDDCSGSSKCHLTIDIRDCKKVFKKIKTVGFYEEIPMDINVDGIVMRVRIYPYGETVFCDPCLGFVLQNKGQIINRIIADRDVITCKVSLGGQSKPLKWNLQHYHYADEIYKTVQDFEFSKHKNLNFVFRVEKTYFSASTSWNLASNLKMYSLCFHHGTINIYSSKTTYDGQDFVVQEMKNDEINNVNKKDLPRVRSEPCMVAAIGGPFEHSIFGRFAKSNGNTDLLINFPLSQMNAILFFMLCNVVHQSTNPILMYMLGGYVCNNEMKIAALQFINNTLSTQNIVEYCKFYDTIRVNNCDGLDCMATFINVNLTELTRPNRATNRSIYDELASYTYVLNHIKSLKDHRCKYTD